jgi:hypothetical protein
MQIEHMEHKDPTQAHGAFIGSAVGCALVLAMLIGLSMATATNRELAAQIHKTTVAEARVAR